MPATVTLRPVSLAGAQAWIDAHGPASEGLLLGHADVPCAYVIRGEGWRLFRPAGIKEFTLLTSEEQP
jgi:hypothetical protein